MPIAEGKPGRNCPRCRGWSRIARRCASRSRLGSTRQCLLRPVDARVLIVGLAPGVQGANRTGRPFTGDFAGVLLYETLSRYGFANGNSMHGSTTASS